MATNEFYIGWMAKAPRSFAKHTKKIVVVLFVLVVITGVLLAISQKKFGSGNFEFGQLTEVKGIYFSKPVPCIKAISGKDLLGRFSYTTIPLIGYGKFGADGIMAGIAQQKNISLDNREVTLKGTLLYNDGKLLMQVSANDTPLVKAGAMAAGDLLPVREDLGQMTIKGEIIDPKCYFGVMKPGQGKPHRDCAIRCILGGISPMLKVTNEKGEENYYLLAGADGGKVNEAVRNFVAEPVTLHAHVVKYDDWMVLYVNADHSIQRYSYITEKYGNTIEYCSADCEK